MEHTIANALKHNRDPEKRNYEVISYGADPETDLTALRDELKKRFAMREEAIGKLLSGEYHMYPLYRDQAVRLARDLSRLGVHAEIRRRAEEPQPD